MKYKQKKEMEQRSICRFYPPHLPPIYPLAPIPPAPLPLYPYPPGIIGGDYDQTPVVLPRPRFDPIGPLPGHLPGADFPIGRRSLRPGGNRAADIRRGFIWTPELEHVQHRLVDLTSQINNFEADILFVWFLPHKTVRHYRLKYDTINTINTLTQIKF